MAYAISDIFNMKETQLHVILMARFIVGIDIAGISSTVTALIVEYYTGINEVKVLSYQSAVISVDLLILEYNDGALVEISWREPFLIYLIGTLILLMVILTIRKLSRENLSVEEGAESLSRKVDIRLITVCCVTIFVVMTWGFYCPPRYPRSSRRSWLCPHRSLVCS